MRGRRKTARISEAEWNIMKVLWKGTGDHGRGMTLGEIVTELSEPTGWSDTTIRTLIIRLSEKGAVSIDKSTGVYKYTPIPSFGDSVAAETNAFLMRVYDGKAVDLIIDLLKSASLSEEDREAIRKAL